MNKGTIKQLFEPLAVHVQGFITDLGPWFTQFSRVTVPLNYMSLQHLLINHIYQIQRFEVLVPVPVVSARKLQNSNYKYNFFYCLDLTQILDVIM